MGLYKLIMPIENAYEVLNVLGRLELLHLIDSDAESSVLTRPYRHYIERCD